MKLKISYYKSPNNVPGIKILSDGVNKSKYNDWDLYIYELGLLRNNKTIWVVDGVDEI